LTRAWRRRAADVGTFRTPPLMDGGAACFSVGRDKRLFAVSGLCMPALGRVYPTRPTTRPLVQLHERHSGQSTADTVVVHRHTVPPVVARPQLWYCLHGTPGHLLALYGAALRKRERSRLAGEGIRRSPSTRCADGHPQPLNSGTPRARIGGAAVVQTMAAQPAPGQTRLQDTPSLYACKAARYCCRPKPERLPRPNGWRQPRATSKSE